jgi:NIPSNAP
MPEVIERGAEKIPQREKMSPFIGAWQTTSERLSRLVHVWAYDDEAIASGAWPPNTHAEGMLLHQHNILAIPAPFSPWH